MTCYHLIVDTTLRADMIDALHTLTLGASDARTKALVDAFKALWDGVMPIAYDDDRAAFCLDGMPLTQVEQELLDYALNGAHRRESAAAA